MLTALLTPPESQDVASKVMGAQSCKKCHESEYQAWTGSMHFKNHERITSANGKQYASKMGGTSTCVACHSTPHTATAQFAGTAGVSCESCHSAAGGSDGWFELHSNYGSEGLKREEETAEHRKQRLEACDATSMIRSSNIYELAKNCYSCHIVADEKLLSVGHKPGHSDFDLIPWMQGEVRHNFQVDQKNNAESPSLLKARDAVSVDQRKRELLVVGKMVELEICLENLSAIDAGHLKEGYAGRKGWAGRAEDAFEYLEEDIGEAITNPHVVAAVKAVEDIDLGRKFKDQAAAKAATVNLAEAAKAFAASASTADLAGLDELIEDLDKAKGNAYKP
ncbi:MAG: multiheme c-type cytochrome [Fuerstiella sp.]